ncbi:MAG: XdhC family protein [Acidobacteria bacterium]|nr:XdhC family protein [Acidobacteriota bacterium]MBP9110500.1 XdhC family protein [Pyrinomonadaceae bacterium]
MSKELELWNFIASRLNDGESVMLLVVANSKGSSPGRAGYKMAVASNGELYGSIGGGVMEVNLVEQSRAILSEPGAIATGPSAGPVIEQVHQKNAPNSSGMICSGKQTVILKPLSADDSDTVNRIVNNLSQQQPAAFQISHLRFQIVENTKDNSSRYFSKTSETEFVYEEKLGSTNRLLIIGGGHCALALSELMSRLDFHIRIFDDRPELNTIEKNEFADEVTIVDGYEKIGEYVESDEQTYVVVMTLGYASDAVVIRQLVDRNLKYFGVLGSKAKMAALMKELRAEGIENERLTKIRTPIGLPINSRTPEEIAISIAAEIIAVKNDAET